MLADANTYFYRIFRRVLNDSLYFYHADHLGTPIAMSDSGGAFAWRAEHLPFGGVHSLPVAAVANNLRFPGQYFDGETALHQNRYREYSSAIGRYVEPDPLRLRGGINVYSYARNNPPYYSDPLGLKVERCCAPAQIAGGFVDHCWLKTDKREAGLGHLDEGQPAGQAVPGAGCDSPYLAQTQIVDHTSQSQSRSDVKCEEIPDVDEACVDDKLWTGMSH